MDHSPAFLGLIDSVHSKVRDVTVEQTRARLLENPSLQLVDVREDSEWSAGHIAGASHLGKGVIERDIETSIPDKEAEIILYCGGGFRSVLAADAIQKMGYTNVASMAGGWRGWKAAGSTGRMIFAALIAVVSLGIAPSTATASTIAPFQTTATDTVPHRKAVHKKHISSRARAVSDTTRSRKTPPPPAFTVTPLPNSLLPGNRIVVFYGNPLSKRMGVLGEYPQATMIAKLQDEVHKFQLADPSTPVKPGFHLIVSVAQGSPGKNGLYRLRMTDSLITYWCNLAQSKGYLIFLDVQIGKSTVQAELKPLIPYLKRPYVHLALDPEFSMHHASEGYVPGKKVGVMDAAEINYAIKTLADLVTENHLPPKILVVHRYTQAMVTNYREIHPVPQVQFVMNMDGFGDPQLKRDSYNAYERMQPVQFDGFKLFYKNDRPMLTAEEVVKLKPSPLFITFQ